MRVYLAGPIGAQTYTEATTWRQTAARALAAFDITAYSPMRSKAYIAKSGGPISSQPNAYGTAPLSTSKGIMARDYNDCVKADALLINFSGTETISLGTAMELAWAYHLHIPTVVIGPASNVNIAHPMAHEAIKFRVDTLEEAVALIRTIIQPADLTDEEVPQ